MIKMKYSLQNSRNRFKRAKEASSKRQVKYPVWGAERDKNREKWTEPEGSVGNNQTSVLPCTQWESQKKRREGIEQRKYLKI
jgi:hypothetical protein